MNRNNENHENQSTVQKTLHIDYYMEKMKFRKLFSYIQKSVTLLLTILTILPKLRKIIVRNSENSIKTTDTGLLLTNF